MCVSVQNFIKIGQTVAEIGIYHFLRWRLSAILDLLGKLWDKPTMSVW